MKKSTYLCCLALLCLFLTAEAQQNQNIQPLTIGDKVPDVTINNILNHPTGKAQLSDYRGQWLILDFWATWCSPCIAMFPKTDSLQEVFEGQVQFLAVTYEGEEKVKKLFSKLEKLKRLNPVMATGDNTLRFLFPHKELPHYVWIDPEGEVRAITGLEEVTGPNIMLATQNRQKTFAIKQEKRIAYDKTKPLFINGNGGSGEGLVYNTLLSTYVDGLMSGTKIKTDTLVGRRVTVTNLPIPALYMMAFRDQGYFGYNRLLVEVGDPSKVLYDKGTSPVNVEEWMSRHAYCYEILVPPEQSQAAFKIMKTDLDRYFTQYNVVLEKRKMNCLVLIRTGDEDKLKTIGGQRKAVFTPVGASLHNEYLNILILQLKAVYLQNSPMPILDETRYTGKVDIDIHASLSDVEAMNRELVRYGLKFIEAEREVDFIIIRDAIAVNN